MMGDHNGSRRKYRERQAYSCSIVPAKEIGRSEMKRSILRTELICDLRISS